MDSVDFDIFATAAIKEIIIFTFILILIPIFKRVIHKTILNLLMSFTFQFTHCINHTNLIVLG